MIKVAILTISDKCSKGKRVDESGQVIKQMIKEIEGKVIKYETVPDEVELIKERLISYCDDLKVDLVLTSGGTGFSPRDLTPEATGQVVEKLVPGIPEAMRSEGLKSTKRAMLSRGIAGIRGKTIIINLPGSLQGTKESLEAIIDIIPHGIGMLRGQGH